MKENSFKDKIKEGINDVFYIWKEEFVATFKDEAVLTFLLLLPLAYPLLYAFIYKIGRAHV